MADNVNKISYSAISWQNGPAGGTAINATNLNIMDKGISRATSSVNDLIDYTDDIKSSVQRLASIHQTDMSTIESTMEDNMNTINSKVDTSVDDINSSISTLNGKLDDNVAILVNSDDMIRTELSETSSKLDGYIGRTEDVLLTKADVTTVESISENLMSVANRTTSNESDISDLQIITNNLTSLIDGGEIE